MFIKFVHSAYAGKLKCKLNEKTALAKCFGLAMFFVYESHETSNIVSQLFSTYNFGKLLLYFKPRGKQQRQMVGQASTAENGCRLPLALNYSYDV